jgi:hypothetical protein
MKVVKRKANHQNQSKSQLSRQQARLSGDSSAQLKVASAQKRVKHSQEKNEDDDPDSGSRNIKRPRVQDLAPTTATETDGSEGVRSTCQDGYCVPCYELA